MKYYNIFKLAIVVMLSVAAVALAGCSNDDDDSKQAVVLEAYGPSPAFRGAKLTFIGRNMDRVASVILPDNIEITDIERLSNEQIKVVIPQHAAPGLVSIKTVDGTIITSKSLLAYTEPIVIETIAPNPVKPGTLLTIEGDYLNLVEKIIFAEDIVVDSEEFATWERDKIVLTVPMQAQTGEIILSDYAPLPLELTSEEILTVVLPSVEAVLDLSAAKPGDEVKVAVKDIDLVASLELPDGTPIEYGVNDGVISFILPAGATDGAISMVAHSGVKVVVAQLGMAVPLNLEATPAEGLRGGDVITIKGTNMELVTTVIFPGVADAQIPTVQSPTEIAVTLPEMATSGDIILNTASGNTTSVTIQTLKPSVSAYNPSPVSAGSDLVIEGENLDLVATVTLGGGKVVEPITAVITAISVTVPVDAESGEVILTMKNGETVTCPNLDVDKPVFCYIPILPGDDEEIFASTILTLDVENGDKLTGVLVNNAAVQYIYSEGKLYINIPSNAGGKTTFTLVSSNGSVDYIIQVIGSGTSETVIMDEVRNLGSWTGEADGGAFRLYKESFEGVAAGSILNFYFAVTGYGMVQMNNANWASWDTLVFEDPSVTSYEFEMTQAFLDNILNTNDGWSTTAMVIQGKEIIINKVSIITKAAPAELVRIDSSRYFG